MHSTSNDMVNRVLHGSASKGEAQNVVEWFSTSIEGQQYLSDMLDKDAYLFEVDPHMGESLTPLQSDHLYKKIEKTIYDKQLRRRAFKAAAVFLPLLLIAALGYLINDHTRIFEETSYAELFVPKGEDARVKLENLRKELTENKTELLTLKGQLRIIEVEKYNELNEVAIYEEQTKLIKEHDRIEKAYTIDNDNLQEERKKRDLLKGRLDTNVIELENEKSAIVKIEKDIDSELANSDFKSVEEVKTILSESINIQNEKKRVDQFYKTLLENRTSFEHINKEVGGQIYDKVYHDKLNSEIRLINDQLDMFIKERVEIEINLKNLKKNIEIHNQLRKELEDVEHRSENLKTMKSLFKASGFVNYISSVYLQNLCNAANDRFFQLTRQKLSLEITPENNFQIRDYMNGGKERSVKTLSGGQTFQASLSLALALADNIQKITQSHQNFFFLDEGFGSLDREALSVVLDTLKTLRKENRTVGIISHVEEMQQEIEVHLRIENSSERGSIVHYSWEE
jgi:exonuclease SbcC